MEFKTSEELAKYLVEKCCTIPKRYLKTRIMVLDLVDLIAPLDNIEFSDDELDKLSENIVEVLKPGKDEFDSVANCAITAMLDKYCKNKQPKSEEKKEEENPVQRTDAFRIQLNQRRKS
jgi:hypothetical protein